MTQRLLVPATRLGMFYGVFCVLSFVQGNPALRYVNMRSLETVGLRKSGFGRVQVLETCDVPEAYSVQCCDVSLAESCDKCADHHYRSLSDAARGFECLPCPGLLPTILAAVAAIVGIGLLIFVVARVNKKTLLLIFLVALHFFQFGFIASQIDGASLVMLCVCVCVARVSFSRVFTFTLEFLRSLACIFAGSYWLD